MRTTRLILGCLAFVSLAGCTAVKTGPLADLRSDLEGGSYTLTVKSDVPQLDQQSLYKIAHAELAPLLPIGTNAPHTGEVQVRFSTEQMLSDPAIVQGVDGAVATMGGVGATPTVQSGGPRIYINGTLLVAIKSDSGKRIWYASYNHDGRFSLAATPEDVARLSMKRVAEQLRKDMKAVGLMPVKGTTK